MRGVGFIGRQEKYEKTARIVYSYTTKENILNINSSHLYKIYKLDSVEIFISKVIYVK